MEIKVRKFNSCYFPSDVGSDSLINIASAGYTYGQADYYAAINSSDSPSLGMYELEYITEGIFYVDIGENTYTATEGDFVLINKNLPRTLHTNKNNPVRKCLLNLKGPLVDAMMKGFGFNDTIMILKSDVKEYFLKILGTLGEAASYTQEIEGKIAAILTQILHKVYMDNKASKVEKIRPKCSAVDILRYIDMNIDRKFTIEEMCDYFYISRAKLWSIFKKQYGHTPLEYLQTKRIEKAKYYLLHTEHPISYIHEIVGLGDPKYFSKLFKKETGMTPLQFRRTFYGIDNVSQKVISNTEMELKLRKTGDGLRHKELIDLLNARGNKKV